jgi:lipopolysaccharide transport system ATP-binding protein
MSETVIQIESLSKKYLLGKAAGAEGLRHTIHDFVTSPLRWRKKTGAAEVNNNSRPTDEFWALKEVSFDVKQGEVVGVIGRNGAGKSTLLKILSRITEQTSGRVEITGRVSSLLEVGTGFHPELTGRENIFLNGAILGMSRTEIRKKFDEIVAFAEVEKFLETPVKRYSSGMYVRLAFAVAAHLEPEILIVDEVLAVGDAEFQKKCLGKMSEVAKGGRTILFVSHNLAAVRKLCSSAIWLEKGKVRMQGEMATVTEQYFLGQQKNDDLQVNLKDLPRPDWVKSGFRIVKVELNKGKPVVHGEPLIVGFEYQSQKAHQDVSIGFGLSTLDGVRILSMDSDLRAARCDLPATSSGYVQVTIDQLHLQPGRYLLDVGARCGDMNGLDYAPGCCQVEVIPGAHTPSFIIRGDGGVRYPGNWKWTA